MWGCMALILLISCKKNSAVGNPPVVDTPIIKGADISWLTQMESQGLKFYNSSGTAMDCMQLVQSLGINAIRLRVWVDPPADGTATRMWWQRPSGSSSWGCV